jgi:hypothetical protein
MLMGVDLVDASNRNTTNHLNDTVSLIAQIDEFKSAWRVLGELASVECCPPCRHFRWLMPYVPYRSLASVIKLNKGA